MTDYTITTSDPVLYRKLFDLATATPEAATSSVAAVVAPAPKSAPAPAPKPAPAPAPAPAPVPAQPQGQAPEGWTIEHVTNALAALGADTAKGGPAAAYALLQKYGVKSVTALDPALWPQFYNDVQTALA